MNLKEAQDECQRWLAYLKRQEEKSVAMQTLAADVRNGRADRVEVARRRALIDRNPVVYDGARLSEAVRFLLEYVDKI